MLYQSYRRRETPTTVQTRRVRFSLSPVVFLLVWISVCLVLLWILTYLEAGVEYLDSKLSAAVSSYWLWSSRVADQI